MLSGQALSSPQLYLVRYCTGRNSFWLNLTGIWFSGNLLNQLPENSLTYPYQIPFIYLNMNKLFY
ncbi:hypothetical protein AHMF7605_09250 [Adhaeribacter arboris]|uniref:Uncharacterized protein n=1 Tax=Adhaeribacter arboris TaxID=2072846 RepID=A0A2T2YDV8_9BACT|nr:hypothetical protein AHMF7605_09250 [Adhaeribacter arboris]